MDSLWPSRKQEVETKQATSNVSCYHNFGTSKTSARELAVWKLVLVGTQEIRQGDGGHMKIVQLLDDKWFHLGEEIACKKILRCDNLIEL